MSISGKIKKIAEVVMENDETEFPKEQFDFLHSFKDRHKFFFENKDLDGLLQELKKKHLIDSITICTADGSMILSSDGNGSNKSVSYAAIFNYVRSEIKDSEVLLVKAGLWKMLIPYQNKLYIVTAASDLTLTELHALIKELEMHLGRSKKLLRTWYFFK